MSKNFIQFNNVENSNNVTINSCNSSYYDKRIKHKATVEDNFANMFKKSSNKIKYTGSKNYHYNLF